MSPFADATRRGGSERNESVCLWAVVPAYRARTTICRVIEGALQYVDGVVVVDDACPDGTSDAIKHAFGADSRVIVVRHDENRGVGGAIKTAIAAAIEVGATIIVKLDADDQMDPSYIPFMIDLLETYPYLGMVKGNRFASPLVLRTMPFIRLIGNSGLSFIVKATSGFWNIIDPTNGYIACRVDTLHEIELRTLADRYFFEIDLLCAFGLRRTAIAELEMDAIYGAERSGLSIRRTLVSFPGRLFARFLRRLFVQYVLVDINVATLYAVLGVPLFLAGLVFGSYEWAESARTTIPRTSGTVVLALLLFVVGFQLMLQAIAFDVSNAPRTLKARVIRGILDAQDSHEHHSVVVRPRRKQ